MATRSYSEAEVEAIVRTLDGCRRYLRDSTVADVDLANTRDIVVHLGIPVDDLVDVLQEHMLNGDNGEWFPRPRDLVKARDRLRQRKARIASDVAVENLRRSGTGMRSVSEVIAEIDMVGETQEWAATFQGLIDEFGPIEGRQRGSALFVAELAKLSQSGFASEDPLLCGICGGTGRVEVRRPRRSRSVLACSCPRGAKYRDGIEGEDGQTLAPLAEWESSMLPFTIAKGVEP